MKNIKDYQTFESIKIDSSNFGPDTIFYWLSYDDSANDPIQSSIPEKLKFSEIASFVKENSSKIPEISKAGLFIAHVPSSFGFDRFTLVSFDPVLLDVSSYDKEFKMSSEYKGINPEELDLGSFSKGVGIIRRFKL
jgi:hypothetical protein